MRRAVLAATTFVAACVLAVSAVQPREAVTVSPSFGIAGHYGTWTVTCTVGPGGIAPGGALRVQLPDTWHAGERNSGNRLQASDPTDDHYIAAYGSGTDVRVEAEVESETSDFLVKSARPGLDGRSERYVFVVRANVVSGSLREGETISVVYGDTSAGSRGMRAAIVATGPEPILVSVDRDGSGAFEPVEHDATLTSRSGIATELRLAGPSALVVGEQAELHLAAVDLHSNPAVPFHERVTLRVLQGDVDVARTVELPAGQGWTTVPFTPRGEGIVRLEAVARADLLRARSNPMEAFAERPAEQTWWGDLHSHTEHSFDGVGSDVFDYARWVAGLDFHAMTDHSSGPAREGFTRGLGPHVWEEYTAATDAHHAPGEFVTLHAYEASFPAPWGHHNVYFRGEPGPLLSPNQVTLPELWAALTAGEALTIPHHTNKFPQPLDWEAEDPALRRNFEIYSAHGLSEAYDPSHPLAFEQSEFTNRSTSARTGVSAQDAWMQGLRLSTIAASDDHRSQPGKPHWGLAAVRAPELTREAVFDALHARRTYGTTGQRILLDFRVNDAPMGSEIALEAPLPEPCAGTSPECGERAAATAALAPRFDVTAHGTDVIEAAEILRYSEPDGGFRVIHDLRPNALDFTWSGRDGGFRDDAIYYLRLRQRSQVRGRVVMAWSSPVWVNAR
jgi:hypothetical protein